MPFYLPNSHHQRTNYKRPVTNPLEQPISEHTVFHLQSPVVLENELFLDNTEKEAKLVNLKTVLFPI